MNRAAYLALINARQRVAETQAQSADKFDAALADLRAAERAANCRSSWLSTSNLELPDRGAK